MKRSFLVSTCIALALLVGCAGKNTGQEEGAPVNGRVQTRTVKDAKGEVQIPAKPQRIADISGSTEELLVMGFRPVASGNTDMGDATRFTPIIAGRLDQQTINTGWYGTQVSVEAIAAANPDLIIAGPRQEKIYEQLAKIAPTVRVAYDYFEFRERFAFLAGMLDAKQEMEAWLKEYDARARQLHDQITAITGQETFAVIEATAKEIRVYSKSGVADIVFQDMKLPQAPGGPEPDRWGGKVTNLEALLTLNPDHLILMADSSQNVLEQSQLFSGLKAFKSGKVYRMTSKQNFNEAFTALGKRQLLDQLSKDIMQKAK